jgi:hypothetical protein
MKPLFGGPLMYAAGSGDNSGAQKFKSHLARKNIFNH